MITHNMRGTSTNTPSTEELDRFRLAVVAELANAPPLASWPPAHLKSFQELLTYFFRASLPGTRRLVVVEDPASYSISAISELKAWTESFLERWFSDGRAIIAISAEDLSRRPLLMEFVRDKSGQGTIGTVKGGVDTVYSLTVAALLTSAEGARLRRCNDEKCGNYFVKTGKKTHCSTKCGRRVYMRALRREQTSGKTKRRVTKR